MSHNATPSEIGNGVGVLTIGATRRPSQQQAEARITKVGVSHAPRGIRIRLRHEGRLDHGLGIDIVGEDLYALREFLAELPEEAFVRPADPVVKPPRWADNDVVEETLADGRIVIWVRRHGVWSNGVESGAGDVTIEAAMRPASAITSTVSILRQASGQDL